MPQSFVKFESGRLVVHSPIDSGHLAHIERIIHDVERGRHPREWQSFPNRALAMAVAARSANGRRIHPCGMSHCVRGRAEEAG